MTWSEKAFQQGVIGLKKSLDKAVEISLAERGYKNMEKIKLTQKQADLIEEIKSWQSEEHQSINYLSAEDIAKCILAPDSYEVMPQYKAGDWVINFDERAIGKIEFVDENTYYGKWYKHPGDDETMECGTDAFSRHATDDEKKKGFWWSIGRKEDEYKDDDLVVTKWGDFGFIDMSEEDICVTNRYPVILLKDSSIACRPADELRLVVRPEDRLDK